LAFSALVAVHVVLGAPTETDRPEPRPTISMIDDGLAMVNPMDTNPADTETFDPNPDDGSGEADEEKESDDDEDDDYGIDYDEDFPRKPQEKPQSEEEDEEEDYPTAEDLFKNEDDDEEEEDEDDEELAGEQEMKQPKRKIIEGQDEADDDDEDDDYSFKPEKVRKHSALRKAWKDQMAINARALKQGGVSGQQGMFEGDIRLHMQLNGRKKNLDSLRTKNQHFKF